MRVKKFMSNQDQEFTEAVQRIRATNPAFTAEEWDAAGQPNSIKHQQTLYQQALQAYPLPTVPTTLENEGT